MHDIQADRRHALTALRQVIRKKKFDAYLTGQTANVRYLSGFTNNECWLLVGLHKIFLFADSRYRLQAEQEVSAEISVIDTSRGFYPTIATILKTERFIRIACEARSITVDCFQRFKQAAPAQRFHAGDDYVTSLRQIKTPAEIAIIRQAIAITKKALAVFSVWLKPGITELAAKQRLELLLLRQGADAPAFDTIVAGGPQAAIPHAVSGRRPLVARKPIVVDVGACCNGYNSDLTRTYFLHTIATRNKYYQLVRQAQQAALEIMGPGITISEVDQAARAVFRAAKMEEYFQHALGHGVGLEVHELPSLSPSNHNRLTPGMVLTVEPGLYIPGWGGVRIEDMVLITETGREILSHDNA